MKLVNAEEVRQIFDYEVAQGATDLFDAFDSAIENATAVDAAPVVHGRWDMATDGDGVVCSVCGTDFCVLLNETENFNYCPNCGAKMDGERKDNGSD